MSWVEEIPKLAHISPSSSNAPPLYAGQAALSSSEQHLQITNEASSNKILFLNSKYPQRKMADNNLVDRLALITGASGG